MASQSPSPHSRQKAALSPEKYARLKAESKAPYRGLRQLIYLTFGASGLLGALVFLGKLASGNDTSTALGNLTLQVGVVVLMVWLFRLEEKAKSKREK